MKGKVKQHKSLVLEGKWRKKKQLLVLFQDTVITKQHPANSKGRDLTLSKRRLWFTAPLSPFTSNWFGFFLKRHRCAEPTFAWKRGIHWRMQHGKAGISSDCLQVILCTANLLNRKLAGTSTQVSRPISKYTKLHLPGCACDLFKASRDFSVASFSSLYILFSIYVESCKETHALNWSHRFSPVD